MVTSRRILDVEGHLPDGVGCLSVRKVNVVEAVLVVDTPVRWKPQYPKARNILNEKIIGAKLVEWNLRGIDWPLIKVETSDQRSPVVCQVFDDRAILRQHT